MKLYIQRYQQVMQVSVDEKSLCSLTSFTELLIEQINSLWMEFLLSEGIVILVLHEGRIVEEGA